MHVQAAFMHAYNLLTAAAFCSKDSTSCHKSQGGDLQGTAAAGMLGRLASLYPAAEWSQRTLNKPATQADV